MLDELITKLDCSSDELAYSVVIEKLYNLCWNSHIKEAYALARRMIESCAKSGNVKVMRWFERYLCTIHFFAGRMKEAVYYYERSLELSEEERNFLGVHSTGIYAAKAYQMLGDRNRSLSVLAEELQRLRNTGNYEERGAGYLLAAEIQPPFSILLWRMNMRPFTVRLIFRCIGPKCSVFPTALFLQMNRRKTLSERSSKILTGREPI